MCRFLVAFCVYRSWDNETECPVGTRAVAYCLHAPLKQIFFHYRYHTPSECPIRTNTNRIVVCSSLDGVYKVPLQVFQYSLFAEMSD